MKSEHKYSSPDEANAKNNMDIEDPQKAPSQRSISTRNIVIGIAIVSMSIVIITIAVVFSKGNEQIGNPGKLGSVASPVIQANGRLTFEDDLRSGGLLYFTTRPH